VPDAVIARYCICRITEMDAKNVFFSPGSLNENLWNLTNLRPRLEMKQENLPCMRFQTYFHLRPILLTCYLAKED
jgi:hypothetical protein